MKKLIQLCLLFAASAIMSCGNSNNEGSASVSTNTDTVTNSSTNGGEANNTNGNGTLAENDSQFLMDAAKGGMKEVAAGEAAQKKAISSAAKDVATMMVKDHTAMNDQVKALATKKNVTLPASLPDDEMSKVNDMNKLSGAEFDKAYLDAMVKDHEATISKFEDASNNAKDPDVKALAIEALPKLRHHLEMVQSAQKKSGGKGGDKK